MDDVVKILDIDAGNVEKYGFFCLKSRPKSDGYRRKLSWLQKRFDEGMKIKLLFEGKRMVGFIEYIPAEFAWRVVNAPEYLVIHCLWVVGKSKGKGYGTQLVNECLEDARQLGRGGVAMVTSSGTWLADRRVLIKSGFQVVDRTRAGFDLLARRFDAAPVPAFPTDWERRLERLGAGLTMLTTDQCPYLETVEAQAVLAAEQRGLGLTAIRLQDAKEVQEKSVSPYGIYNLVYNSRLITHHWEPEEKLARLFDDAIKN